MTAVNRISRCFDELAARREKGLIAYICAGDPDLDTTVRLVEAIAAAGADLVELGIPFSDPVADGPSIQRAAARALAGGVKVAQIIAAAARIRRRTDVPLIFMTYYNPVLQYGLEEFVRDAASAGVDGLIVPDLPLEEAGALLAPAGGAGLALIPLVAPTTTPERLQAISAAARGFVYCVSVTGVTGARQEIHTDLAKFTGRVRAYTGLPLAVGFGISGPAAAARVAPCCDAVVVGSAIVDRVAAAADSDPVPAAAGLAGEIKSALVNL
ncbi:tryptophan synthase subunit alpha [Desulfotomaculum copahuensis]|uniref:Tryptophan synthase alpha chain n=1 Tax=Desulfotomaculum copahuensis TaxID=1838280 RepID=A0A1B7LIL0_9FIRM|nr:tryptophan synthase subunit alpha [Desulfotomaculum copahuensis]